MIMESKSALHVLAFLAILLVASEAGFTPELYWKSKLPNTPMPQAIRDILPYPDLSEDKITSVVVGKGGVGVDTGKGRPVYVEVNPGPDPFVYIVFGKHSSDTEAKSDPAVAKFFLEKDLAKGGTMTLRFTWSAKGISFLPREVSDSIPFSSSGLPEAMARFSVRAGSAEARAMETTVEECEAAAVKGEEKYCATSLESMVDYTKSKLGQNLKAISSEISDKNAHQMQKYKIVGNVKKINYDVAVICHKMKYPYAVFYCHKTNDTKAFIVPMMGEDGSEVKAVAVCHTDTSQWNPKHQAFRVLGVRPGSVPICHFLPQDHIVWYGN